MGEPATRHDSLFRGPRFGVRKQPSWLHSAVQDSRRELSDSPINTPAPVNRTVRTGTSSDFKLSGTRGQA